MEQATTTPTLAGDGSHNGHPAPRRAPAERAAGEPLRVVELGDLEREACAEAVDRHFLDLAAAAGVEPATADFFDAAEILEGALPESVRAAMADLRRGAAPAVVVRGLAADPDPGPTPTTAGDPPLTPRRGHAWLAMTVRRLGDEFAYAMEKKGALVHNVYPTREGAATQSNASFKVNLSLHTENAFHPIRPAFVCLYCVRTPPEAPATRLVFLDDVLDQLTDFELAVLREPRFTLRVVDSHRAEGEEDVALPVAPLTGSPRRPVVRWHETLRATDDVAARVAKSFGDAATRATRHVKLGEGDLLAFANETCLHGRDSFDARLDGTDRWLLRGYALRDLTPTLSYVAPARPRVTRVDLSARAGG